MIELRGLRKSFGAALVIDDLSLDIARGSLTVLLGPSGCGKSTLLRMINRLIVPDAGTIRIDGCDIAAADPVLLRRGIGYAIQDAGLFPHWTVAQNIGTVPRLLGWHTPRIAQRVMSLLELLDLPPDRFASKYSASLSGGQKQRVGVARALAADPPVLLMDEPFGALDPITRRGLQAELRRIQRDTGKTTLFVTHDMDEALALADRIVLLNRGKVAQQGTPLDILTQPSGNFVRDFVGGDALGLRTLSVLRVADRVVPTPAGPAAAAQIGEGASLRDALETMLAVRADRLAVIGAEGTPIGSIGLCDLIR